jgi:hypothetical protein
LHGGHWKEIGMVSSQPGLYQCTVLDNLAPAQEVKG